MADNPNQPPIPPLGPPQPLAPRRGLGGALRTYFFTGLLVAGPLTLTVYISWWLIALVDGWVRPLIPQGYNPELYLPFPVPGVGIIVAFVVLTLIGFLTANLVGRSIVGIGEGILDRMPFVRSLYKGLKQIFETVFKQDSTSFRRVGMIEWPGPNLWSICLIADPSSNRLTGPFAQPGVTYVNVFVPCTPNPTTGYFVVMPEALVKPIDISVDEAFKVIMSMGIIQPDDAAPPMTEDATRPGSGVRPRRARKHKEEA